MRLGDFILANTKPILAEWEAFAREIWPAAGQAPADLRDRAEEILRATASDMTSPQTAAEQAVKSKGESDAAATSARIIQASGTHAIGRVASGFDLMEIIAEYRMIVIGHGGTISVASSAESGTTFTIHLPRRARLQSMP